MQEALIDKLKRGEESAWAEFFEQYDSLIKNVTAWSKWHFDPQTREDLAQQIRLELHRKISDFQGKSSLEYYIKTVCINRCIDEVRKDVRKRQTFVSMALYEDDGEWEDRDAPDDTFDPVKQAEKLERASIVQELLDLLDRTCKDAIRDFYINNLSYKELSAKYRIAVNTVGSRMSKCLDKLRNIVEESKFNGEDLSPSFD